MISFLENIKNRVVVSVFLAIIIWLLIFLFSPILYFFNKYIQDFSYKLSNYMWNSWVNKNIVLVEIDSETLKELWRFPFDRKAYIPVIENLNNLWAEIIWFDVLFPDKSNIISDFAFSKAIKKAWNIVLWASIDYDKNSNLILEKPNKVFLQNADNLWLLTPNIDINSKVYELNPYIIIDSEIIEPFSFSLLKSYYSKIYNDDELKNISSIPDDIEKSSSLKYDIIDKIWYEILLSSYEKQNLLINYNPSFLYERISFYDVYSWKYNKDLTSKIVIIWPTAQWIKDEFFTPIWREKGVLDRKSVV